MQIGPLSCNDWPLFKSWAEIEGLQISFQEERLFLNLWQRYVFVLKHRGERCGFVSALAYKNSGWIGNLVVDPDKRHQGYGRALLEHAMQFLKDAGIACIWLVATESTVPFYQNYGFQHYDQLTTWTSTGLGTLPQDPTCDLQEIIDLNTESWGESQKPLHYLLEYDSIPIKAGANLALLQAGPLFWQLGPWLTLDKDAAGLRQLLQQARKKTPANRPLATHILTSADLDLILISSGFSRIRTRNLMYLSDTTPHLKNVLALASAGSIG